MTQPEIVLIAAVARGGVIGIEGKLPWHRDRKANKKLIEQDFDHFKALTRGHPVIMGRATYESIPPKFRPLPERQNVVLTTNPDPSFRSEGVYVVPSLKEALRIGDSARLEAMDYTKLFIGGGQKVYQDALPFATSLEITHVDQDVAPGDLMRYFPRIDPAMWLEQARDNREGFSFVTYQRASPVTERSPQ